MMSVVVVLMWVEFIRMMELLEELITLFTLFTFGPLLLTMVGMKGGGLAMV